MEHETELQTAYKAAKAAGDIMNQYAHKDLRQHSETEDKENQNDMVTEADRKCQEKAVEIIQQEFPEDSIAAEEGEYTGSSEGREWIIDPIDGTANFTTGFPYFCISIAFRIDQNEKVGLIYSPESALSRLWYAVEDEGAYRSDSLDLNGQQTHTSGQKSLEGAMILSRLSERNSERRKAEKPIISDLLDEGIMLRRAASAALNLCMVADGSVDGFALISINDWDIAAGSLILEEAGGEYRIQDSVFDGYIEIVASNGPVQEEIEDIMDKHLRI